RRTWSGQTSWSSMSLSWPSETRRQCPRCYRERHGAGLSAGGRSPGPALHQLVPHFLPLPAPFFMPFPEPLCLPEWLFVGQGLVERGTPPFVATPTDGTDNASVATPAVTADATRLLIGTSTARYFPRSEPPSMRRSGSHFDRRATASRVRSQPNQ